MTSMLTLLVILAFSGFYCATGLHVNNIVISAALSTHTSTQAKLQLATSYIAEELLDAASRILLQLVHTSTYVDKNHITNL